MVEVGGGSPGLWQRPPHGRGGGVTRSASVEDARRIWSCRGGWLQKPERGLPNAQLGLPARLGGDAGGVRMRGGDPEISPQLRVLMTPSAPAPVPCSSLIRLSACRVSHVA